MSWLPGKESTSKTTPTSQVAPPPPSPQIPLDLGLKANLDLKKKRPVDTLEEGEVGTRKGTKQQKMVLEDRSRRSQSVESREEQYRADVRITQCNWSPRLEVDEALIPWGALVREFQNG